MTQPEELLSVKEVAAWQKRSVLWVWRLRRQGMKFIGGRITAKAVTEFLERRDRQRK